jgi:light-regulated signal transduction histidine kinase (bacteriophytochrome)
MTHLIDDLLTLSQIARAEINRIPLNLSNMVLQIAEELQKLEPERQVEFKIPPGITAHADPVLISSVMENLVGNAWKFTRRTEKPVIEFGSTLEDGITTYFVRDNGAGFDPEYADKLFIAFQRLHRSDEFEGTGIGLVSVQRVIRRHGGSIRAEGSIGEGATFYFTLQPRG